MEYWFYLDEKVYFMIRCFPWPKIIVVIKACSFLCNSDFVICISGTSAGVGFAIPSSTVLKIVPQLIQFGRVSFITI